MRTALALLALTLGCSSDQPAAEPPLAPPVEPRPHARGDGPLDRLEVAAQLVAHMDSNGDGLLDPEEHRRYALPAARFEELDLDASGALDAAELLAAIQGTDPGYDDDW